MTRARTGSIDGVNLDTLHVDRDYEVDQSIASYLIVTGSAEPTVNGAPALVVHGTGAEVLHAMVPNPQPEMASELSQDGDPEGDDSAA